MRICGDYEDVWGNGCIAPLILNIGTRKWQAYGELMDQIIAIFLLVNCRFNCIVKRVNRNE
jgi:hypothetical protein